VGVKVDESSVLANKSQMELGQEFEGIDVLVVAIVREGATIVPRGDHRILPGDRVYVIGERDQLTHFMSPSRPSERPRGSRVILVIGGGHVGERVAQRLEEAGFEVRLLEADRDRSEHLAVTLDHTTVLHGDGRNLTALKESGVESVDGFVSVSGDEETNVMSALLARHLGAPKVIALVKRTEYIPVLREIGLDAAVNPRLTAAGAILRFVRRGHILQVSTFRDIDAEVLELVASERSSVVGKPLRDLDLPRDAILGGYSRGDRFGIPRGNTVLEPHDHVIVFALPSAISKVEKMFSG
jgi:trk system potassium uptake protein TrkA